jgi:hypothetical protein
LRNEGSVHKKKKIIGWLHPISIDPQSNSQIVEELFLHLLRERHETTRHAMITAKHGFEPGRSRLPSAWSTLISEYAPRNAATDAHVRAPGIEPRHDAARVVRVSARRRGPCVKVGSSCQSGARSLALWWQLSSNTRASTTASSAIRNRIRLRASLVNCKQGPFAEVGYMSGSHGPCWLISEEFGYSAVFLFVFGPIKDARPSCLMEDVP